MRCARRSAAALTVGLAACLALASGPSLAQSYKPPGPGQATAKPGQYDKPSGQTAGAQGQAASTPTHSLGAPVTPKLLEQYATGTGTLLKTPVSGLHPGGINPVPKITNPAIGNPTAIQRGMKYFTAFNCVGCHAANGGGGMGPALSDRYFKFGASPANIYLTIVQGRPNGMPAWDSMLPSDVIWDLVAYIEQISKAPVKEWGTTISPDSPKIQQVPAEFKETDQPWSYTQPFGKGQKPTGPYPGE